MKDGKDWTDYTVTFDAKIDNSQAGWMVRGTDSDNIKNVTVPTSIAADTWYEIEQDVSGDTVTTSIDGVEVATFTSSAHPRGTVGFRQFSGEEATYRTSR